MALTEKQELFCQAYLIDFNGAKAAREAGYSEETARSEAWRLLTNVDIQSRISELRKDTANKFNISRERIAQELARIGFSDIRSIFNEDGSLKSPENWPDDVVPSIAGIETDELWEGRGPTKTKVGETRKVRLWEKTKALEALSKLMGYNEPEKHDHTSLGEKLSGFNYLPPSQD